MNLTNPNPHTHIVFRGDRLRALRQQLHISVDRIARATELTTHHIYRLEHNDRFKVWGITIAKLALALNTSCDYLLNLTDDPRPHNTPMPIETTLDL